MVTLDGSTSKDDYGTNYPDDAAERKATRRDVRESWYDAIWAAMFIASPILSVAVWLVWSLGR